MRRSFAPASWCRSMHPTSRWSGTFHSRTSRCRCFEFVENVVTVVERRAQEHSTGPVRLHVCWAIANRLTTATCRSREHSADRATGERRSLVSSLRRPAPRARFRCFEKFSPEERSGPGRARDRPDRPSSSSIPSSWGTRIEWAVATTAIPAPCWPRPNAASTRRRAGAVLRRMCLGKALAASVTGRSLLPRACSDCRLVYAKTSSLIIFIDDVELRGDFGRNS